MYLDVCLKSGNRRGLQTRTSDPRHEVGERNEVYLTANYHLSSRGPRRSTVPDRDGGPVRLQSRTHVLPYCDKEISSTNRKFNFPFL